MLISAVAKEVAKEALVQPISAWPCIPFPFDYDAISSVVYNGPNNTVALVFNNLLQLRIFCRAGSAQIIDILGPRLPTHTWRGRQEEFKMAS